MRDSEIAEKCPVERDIFIECLEHELYGTELSEKAKTMQRLQRMLDALKGNKTNE